MDRKTWQKRRNHINHDWLKNDLALRVGMLLKNITGEVSCDGNLLSLCRDLLREWEGHESAISDLLADFLFEMSPKSLFCEPPLSNCDVTTMSWLPDIVHEAWKKTYSIDELLQEARGALACTNKYARQLNSCIENAEMNKSRESLSLLKEIIGEFRNAVYQLSSLISRFPNRIMV